jgi:hypothetical protein
MEKIEQYRKRFYMLMESEMGNVRPLISEQVCTLSQQEIDQVVKQTINHFSPEVLNDDIDSLDDSFKNKIQSDVVLRIWNGKLQEIKNSLKPVFEKYVQDAAYATFNGTSFDLNSYMYDMLKRIVDPLVYTYDKSLFLKPTVSSFIHSGNVTTAQKNAKNVFADMIDSFFVWFKMTITSVPLHAIAEAKKLKKCQEIKSNPKPFYNYPLADEFKKHNGWILDIIDYHISQAV